MKLLRRLLAPFCIAGLAIAAGASALAQGTQSQSHWPQYPIRLVVPYTAGGQFDIVARMVAAHMGETLGQAVVVDNRPGAGTLIGADIVAKAKADGYTLLYAGANMFAIAPHLYRKMPFQRSDFQTISLVSELPMGLIVSSQLPVRTFPEFIAYVKAHPGAVSFGSSGEGGAQHLLCELVKEKTGIDMAHVPYKGTSQVIQDLLPNRVSAACDGLQSYIPLARDGRVRILAVSSAQRMPSLPDVPTFAELGVPDATVASWGGIVAPAGTPPEVLEKLRSALLAAANAPEVRRRISDDAAVPRTSTAAEFDALIQSDDLKWKAVVARLGLKLD